MLKFEEIVLNEDFKENALIYVTLCKAIHSDEKKIVCYIGAGLSLYCKRWNKLFEHVYDGISPNVKEKNGLKKSWTEYIANKTEIDYLKIADEIDEILKNATPKSSFNKEVRLYINEQIIAKKQLYPDTGVIEYISIGESEENNKIPADLVYYLPYLMPGIPKKNEKQQSRKGRIITTNIDDSIFDAFAYYNLKIMQLQAIHQMDTVEMNQNQHIVFYIHGYYSHIESYVMTGKDYKKTYGNKKNKRLLKEYAYDSEAVWIFLGAGLENDPPLNTLETCFQDMNDKNHQLRNFAFLSESIDKIVPKREKVERKYFANAFFIPQDAFYCYSIVFCQLIREAKGEYWNTFICGMNEQHSLYTANSPIDDEAIKNLLESQKTFDYMEHSVDESLKQKLKNYIYEGYNRNFKWAVCWIESEDFEFSAGNFDPLKYHWPLGNTIYLMHGISRSKRENCITTLEKWCNSSQQVFDNGIKVRVIYQPEREYFIDKFIEYRDNFKEDVLLLKQLDKILNNLKESKKIDDQLSMEYKCLLSFLKGNINEYSRFLFDYVLDDVNKSTNKIYQIMQEDVPKEEYTRNRKQQESTNTDNDKSPKMKSILNLKLE